jgi:hypothetical protein
VASPSGGGSRLAGLELAEHRLKRGLVGAGERLACGASSKVASKAAVPVVTGGRWVDRMAAGPKSRSAAEVAANLAGSTVPVGQPEAGVDDRLRGVDDERVHRQEAQAGNLQVIAQDADLWMRAVGMHVVP